VSGDGVTPRGQSEDSPGQRDRLVRLISPIPEGPAVEDGRRGRWGRPFRRGSTFWRAVTDLAPAAYLVCGFLVFGWILPFLGGPGVLELVQIPYPGSSILAWVALAAVIWGALFVWERSVALVRRFRSPENGLSPLFPAARRFGLRRSNRIMAAVGGAILINYFMPAFLGYKSAIPAVQPFGFWDSVFIQLDRTLHGGHQPWDLFQPLLGHPSATAFLDTLYYFWFQVSVFGFLILVVWSVGIRRSQFLFSFAATWVVLGILMATAMSSVGPCFVGYLEGFDDPYADLMSYLYAVHAERPLQSIQVQEMLWESHLADSRTLTSGIAAMPSLHVAIPALYAVAAWKLNRLVAVVLWVFTGLIFLGSVHLGWHYAVDGYVSLLLIPLVWWGSGWVVRRWQAWLRRRSQGYDSPWAADRPSTRSGWDPEAST